MTSKIVLKSLDKRLIKVDRNMAEIMTIIKANTGSSDENNEKVITVFATGDTLGKVIKWAEYHNKLKIGLKKSAMLFSVAVRGLNVCWRIYDFI